MSFKFIENEHLKFRMPFSAIISGPSSSGKTTLLLKIIKHTKDLFTPEPHQIVYCYGEYNSSIPAFQKMGVNIYSGLPSDEFLSQLAKPALIILDDLMLSADKRYLESLFTIKSHHRNIGVIFVVQNLFEKNIKTARDNSQYLILMNSPSAIRQIRDIGVSLYPHKLKNFMDAYESATKSRYGYLLVDLHANTDNQLRLRTNIFPGEYTRVFIP